MPSFDFFPEKGVGCDLDDLPQHEPMMSRADANSCERYRSGEQFFALVHMLRNGVGRPWSKVHSEIVAKVKAEHKRNLWGDLIRRMEWMVETSPMHVGD